MSNIESITDDRINILKKQIIRNLKICEEVIDLGEKCKNHPDVTSDDRISMNNVVNKHIPIVQDNCLECLSDINNNPDEERIKAVEAYQKLVSELFDGPELQEIRRMADDNKS